MLWITQEVAIRESELFECDRRVLYFENKCGKKVKLILELDLIQP